MRAMDRTQLTLSGKIGVSVGLAINAKAIRIYDLLSAIMLKLSQALKE
jgi:hypothetical protein